MTPLKIGDILAFIMDSQYPLLHRMYPGFLKYDSWLDCSDIFEIPIRRIEERGGRVIGHLTADDKERILEFLKTTELIDNVTKRNFGLM